MLGGEWMREVGTQGKPQVSAPPLKSMPPLNCRAFPSSGTSRPSARQNWLQWWAKELLAAASANVTMTYTNSSITAKTILQTWETLEFKTVKTPTGLLVDRTYVQTFCARIDSHVQKSVPHKQSCEYETMVFPQILLALNNNGCLLYSIFQVGFSEREMKWGKIVNSKKKC